MIFTFLLLNKLILFFLWLLNLMLLLLLLLFLPLFLSSSLLFNYFLLLVLFPSLLKPDTFLAVMKVDKAPENLHNIVTQINRCLFVEHFGVVKLLLWNDSVKTMIKFILLWLRWRRRLIWVRIFEFQSFVVFFDHNFLIVSLNADNLFRILRIVTLFFDSLTFVDFIIVVFEVWRHFPVPHKKLSPFDKVILWFLWLLLH